MGVGRRVYTLCSGMPDRSGVALEEHPETSVYPLTVRPSLVGHDSLLLPLLQLMVPALLVLQQHPSVVQVPGEVVALPLQLVGRLLGLFVSALQLSKLWKEGSQKLTGTSISKVSVM